MNNVFSTSGVATRTSTKQQNVVVPTVPYGIGVNADDKDNTFVYYSINGRDTNAVFMELYRGDNIYLGSYESATCGITIKSGLLLANTSYYIRLRSMSWTNTYSDWSSSYYFRTKPNKCPTPTIISTGIEDTNYAFCQVDDLGFTCNIRWWRYNLDGSVDTSNTGSNTTRARIPIYPGQHIEFKAYNSRSNWEDSDWSFSGRVTRALEKPLCDIFNFSAGQQMTNAKLNDTTYVAYVMGASTWNYFCERINKFREYYNYAHKSTLPMGSFTRVSKDVNFTAGIFNEAVVAINQIGLPITV